MDAQIEEQIEIQGPDTVLGQRKSQFIQLIREQTKAYKRQVDKELGLVRPGHPHYKALKKTDLRCLRILKTLEEIKAEKL